MITLTKRTQNWQAPHLQVEILGHNCRTGTAPERGCAEQLQRAAVGMNILLVKK